jgi:hypothetical protein
MKPIDPEFAARLASGLTTTCLCWRLERLDGVMLHQTEHNRPLTIGGALYEPDGSLTGWRRGRGDSAARSRMRPLPRRISLPGCGMARAWT